MKRKRYRRTHHRGFEEREFGAKTADLCRKWDQQGDLLQLEEEVCGADALGDEATAPA